MLPDITQVSRQPRFCSCPEPIQAYLNEMEGEVITMDFVNPPVDANRSKRLQGMLFLKHHNFL